MNWIFGFFSQSTDKHNNTNHTQMSESIRNTPELAVRAEECITSGMTKAYEQIRHNEQTRKDQAEKEKRNAWNKLIGYKPVPDNICWLGHMGCDIRNAFVVLIKTMVLKRKDVHSNIVIRNDAQQRLLSQLRSRKWMWYGSMIFALWMAFAAIHVHWLLIALFVAYAFVCFTRGRILRIAMFEAEHITDLTEISALHSLYTSSSGNWWSIASVIVGIATVCYSDEMKLIIETILKALSL